MSEGMDRKITLPWWRKRRLIMVVGGVGAVALLVVLGLAFAGGAQRSVRVRMATVTIDPVQRGIYHDFTTLNGTVTPHDTIDLDALAGGQVEKVMVQSGDIVAAGQPLMTFHNSTLELSVLNQVAGLTQSISALQTQEQQFETTRLSNETAAANTDYQITNLTDQVIRQQSLAEKGYIATLTFDQIKDQLDLYQKLKPIQTESNQREEALRVAQLPKIESEVASQQQSLKLARDQLDNLTVKATVAGRLADFNPNIGQNVNAGERLGEIVPDTGFKVAANVDQYYLGRVQQGQSAVAEIADHDWKLRVTKVYGQVKDGTFVIDLDFDGAMPDGVLTGQAITGKLSLGSDQPALILPTGPFLEQSGGDWVMVLSDANHAERRQVKIGRRNAEQVEILSGLKAGDRVITSNYTGFDKIDRIDLTN